MKLAQGFVVATAFMVSIPFAGCGFTEYKSPTSSSTTSPSTGTVGTGGNPGTGTGTGTGSAATFSEVSSQILSNCTSCHSGSSPSAGIDLSTYTGVMSVVSAGNPSGSTIYTVVSGGIMPPSGALPSSDVTLLSDWITSGALDN